MQNLWLSQAAEAQKLLDTWNEQGKYSPTQDRRDLASEAPGRSQRRRQRLHPASFKAAQLEQDANGGQRPPAPADGGQPMSPAQEELQRLQHLLASNKPPAQSPEQLPGDSDSSSSTSESSSSESDDDDDDDPDSDPDPTHDTRKRKKKKKKTKSNGKAAAKRAAKKMRKKILEFILKFQNLNVDFDNEVLQKNPMEMARVMHNMHLQFEKDCVPYAKRNKLSSMRDLRALVIKDNLSVITDLRMACKAADTMVLRRGVNKCIKALTLEYHFVPMGIITMTVLHFLSETTVTEFAERKRIMHALIREAMLTPDHELPGLYHRTLADGRPPRFYTNLMISQRGNIWHGHGVNNFGPLAEDLDSNWAALKEAVVNVICKQVPTTANLQQGAHGLPRGAMGPAACTNSVGVRV